MFSSFNCVNSLESLLKDHPSYQNPSSKQYHDPPFLFNFPSPFLDEHESPLSQIFSQNLEMAATDLHPSDQIKEPKKTNIGKSKLVEKEADQENLSPITTPLRRRNLGVVPRRRTGKKDRHSKICTAQGIRDRRMRLSLQVARKFFDLQDMLGYDKASKTIEWLFTKSKKAINELILHHHQANNVSLSDAKSESFLSECEVVSRIAEKTSNKDFMEGVPLTTRASKSSMRESREKARARARCRTREKMMVKQNPSDNGHVQKLGFSNSPFEGVDQELKFKSQERVSPYEASSNSLGYPLVDVSTIEDFLGNSILPPVQAVSAPIGCAIFGSCSGAFSDANCSFMGFFGNMDLVNNERVSSIYSITNEDSMEGKPNSVYEEIP